MVAIAAGLIGYVSTLYSSYATRKLEEQKSQETLALTRQNQEGNLILEAIKTSGTLRERETAAAANLVFLADAGLITSLNKTALDRLREKAGNALPSLSQSTDLDFRRSAALSSDLQAKLTKGLAEYQKYLVDIGFEAKFDGQEIPIQIDADMNNAYFDGEAVHLGKNLAGSVEYSLSEITWPVLRKSNTEAFNTVWNYPGVQLQAFAYSLKFYLVSSYLNDPLVGKDYWALTGIPVRKGSDAGYLFNLTTSRKWDPTSDPEANEPHRLGEVWAACLWDIRDKLGKTTADELVFTTWKDFKPNKDDLEKPKIYVDAIVTAASKIGGQSNEKLIRDVFASRNLK